MEMVEIGTEMVNQANRTCPLCGDSEGLRARDDQGQVTAEGGPCGALAALCPSCLVGTGAFYSPEPFQRWFMKARVNYQYRSCGRRRPQLYMQLGNVF